MLEDNQQINPQQRDVKLFGTPNQLLKTLESLKNMGINNIKCEFSFNTIQQVETFTRIFNRQQEQERVANQLRTTYFHHVRGKVQRFEIIKDEDYVSMKKIAFTSSYHANLFMKYYHQRVQQMENQYKYKIMEGKAGYLNIYLNDENISSLFLNQLIDMKKKLNFLQIKDPQLCQKFLYSEKLCVQIKKQNIFHEVWYKGKQSTIIFYTQNTTYAQMKKIIDIVSKYHITILKMVDYKFSFLINYLLFGLMKKLIQPQLKTMKNIDSNFIQVNNNKIAIVLHDRHTCFSYDPIIQTLGITKKVFFMNIKAKDARKYYNFLKKQFINQDFVNFCYSKKNICICIHVDKIQDWQKVRKMLHEIAECLDIQSQIIFNFFHLQDPQMNSQRKKFIQQVAIILAQSNFSIQNFQKFIQDKDCKCILKLKDFAKKQSLCNYVSQTILKIIKSTKNIQNNKQTLIEQKKQRFFQAKQLYNVGKQIYSQSSNEDIQYGQQDQDEVNPQKQILIDQNLNESNILNLNPQDEKIYLYKFYEKIIIKQNEIRESRFFESSQQEWIQGKRLKSFEQQLSISFKIITKINKVSLQKLFQEKIPNLKQTENFLFYYPFEQYPHSFQQNKLNQQIIVKSFLKLSLNKKYMIIAKIEQGYNTLKDFPLFTIQILNTI